MMDTYQFTEFGPSGRFGAVHVLTEECVACAPVNSIPGVWSPSEHYFDVAAQAPVAMVVRPSPYHLFNYASKQWQDPRTTTTEWPLVREKRDALLSDTDWVVTKAMELGTPVPDAWKTYRKALRDITMQPDPFAVVWPVLPP